MSANIDTMVYVGKMPWHGLGTFLEEVPTDPQQIVAAAQLDWTVAAARMYTELHDSVKNYKAIYREDNNEVLGVANIANPHFAQNTDMFNAFGDILNKEVAFETAASLGIGEKVFGCFKINDSYKIFDDQIDHYLVVVNDHLKPDGKITIINTPVRVVCQNTLTEALSTAVLKYRIKCSQDLNLNATLANHMISAYADTQQILTAQAEAMYKQKVSREQIDKFLDELFPLIQADESSEHQKANERVLMLREQFITQCVNADNLQNFKGTQYQLFNAVTDWDLHYFKNSDDGLDLDQRMKRLPGIAGEGTITKKALKVLKALAA